LVPGRSADAIPLIPNGSFELGTDPGVFTTLGTGSTAITGWTVTTGTIDYIGTYWSAADGARSVDLNGGSPGGVGLGTDVTTTPGQQYRLTFSLSGNFDGLPDPKLLDVLIDGTPYAFSFSKPATWSHSSMGWLEQSVVFVAADSSTPLEFKTGVLSPCCYGPAIDNVSMTPVPEPASLLLLGSGLVGTGLVVRRTRRKP
jgi:choice-of-anchor C domain-containing protein